MKTLILNGSPRSKGHTMAMVDYMMQKTEYAYDLINAYDFAITPCKDCRYCWYKNACPIDDDMQGIYQLIDAADVIILASPIYFHSIPAPLKTIIDRCQVYWARSKRGEEKRISRIGASLLVGGAPDFKDQFLATEITVKGWLSDLGAEHIGSVKMANSDRVSLETSPNTILALDDLMNEIAMKMRDYNL